MNDFSVLDDAFGPGSLSFARWLLSRGEHLDPVRVLAVKTKNPNWRDDVIFAAFDAWSDGGKKRPRGRPKGHGRVWEHAASAFYPVVLRLTRLKRKQGTLGDVVPTVSGKVVSIDPTLPNYAYAAEALCRCFQMPTSEGRFRARMSARGLTAKR